MLASQIKPIERFSTFSSNCSWRIVIVFWNFRFFCKIIFGKSSVLEGRGGHRCQRKPYVVEGVGKIMVSGYPRNSSPKPGKAEMKKRRGSIWVDSTTNLFHSGRIESRHLDFSIVAGRKERSQRIREIPSTPLRGSEDSREGLAQLQVIRLQAFHHQPYNPAIQPFLLLPYALDQESVHN